MTREDDLVMAVAEEVMRYLAQHPEAADSAEGIQRWWLAARHIEEPLDRVRRALDALVQKGVLVRKALPDGSTVFGAEGRARRR